jgi:hypothetical protein
MNGSKYSPSTCSNPIYCSSLIYDPICDLIYHLIYHLIYDDGSRGEKIDANGRIQNHFRKPQCLPVSEPHLEFHLHHYHGRDSV